jgi:hypothetical protein
MVPNSVLEVGQKYSKKNLSDLLNEPNLSKVREGVASCTNSKSYLLFVDLEKESKEERFHFDDFFEEDFFHWDSQTSQHIDTPKIQDIVAFRLTPHLFVRVKQKYKSKTLPFIYCGRLKYISFEENTSKPVHIIYQNIDFDDFTQNENLLEVYRWKPSVAGMTSKSKVVKKGIITKERKQKYREPDQTERQGLVTSRVGQGFYRQQIIEKWGGKCPISGINILSILISSHIVPWSESNDEERLDVENGILLSPLYDSLFDKHLISFDDDGRLLVSSKINLGNIEKLGLLKDIKITLSEGMIKYIWKHQEKFRRIENELP